MDFNNVGIKQTLKYYDTFLSISRLNLWKNN